MEKIVNVFTENNIQIGTISEAEYNGIAEKARKDVKLHIRQIFMNLKTSMNFFIFGLKYSAFLLLGFLAVAYLAGDKEIVSAVLSAKSLIINGHNDTDIGIVVKIFSEVFDVAAKFIRNSFFISLFLFGILTCGEIRKLFVLKGQKKAIGDDPFFFHRSLYSDRVGLEIKTLLQEPYNGPVWVAYEN